MSELLSNTFYENTIGSWVMAALIILGAFVVGKITYWVFQKLFRKITVRTKSNVDDMILDIIEEPIVFVITVIGIRIGLSVLTLPEVLANWIGNGVQFLVVLAITWLIARLLEAIFTKYIAPFVAKTDTDLDDQLLPIIRKGTKFSVWCIGVIVALNNAGYDVGALIAGLGIGGIALAMAAQDTVANVFGGFTILTDRPFKLNDRVKVSGFDGWVREIGVRSTRIETLEGRIVSIPNAKFSDVPVENVSAEPWRKVVVTLGLTYSATHEDIEKGLDLLRGIARRETLEDDFSVAFLSFGDFSLNLQFVYRIKSGQDILDTQTAVNLEILRQFAEAGLEFAFPTQTLYNIAVDSSESATNQRV